MITLELVSSEFYTRPQKVLQFLFITSLRYMTAWRVLLLGGRYYEIKVGQLHSKVVKHTFHFGRETFQTFRKVERVVV